MEFLFSVNVCVFIPTIIKNCQKWVYIGMGDIFFLETLRGLPPKSCKLHF